MSNLNRFLLAVSLTTTGVILLTVTGILINYAFAGPNMDQVTRLTFQYGGGTSFYAKGASGKRYIITNQHVCEGMVGIVKKNEATDLCAMPAPKGSGGLTIAANVWEQETVFTYGFPDSKPHMSAGTILEEFTWVSNKYSFCNASSNNLCTRTYTSVETTLYSKPGASGSPIVDTNGNLVGVMSSYDPASDFKGGAVKFSDVKAFLGSL